MTALVTGITGFVGSHLAEHLLARGDRVVGLSRSGKWPESVAYLAFKAKLHAVDIVDAAALKQTLKEIRPEATYHLSGQASVPASFASPDDTWRTNFIGSRTLLDAICESCPETKLLIVSTGQVHGQPARSELPITEKTALRPINPYAVSKAAADLLALRYVAERNLRIVIARPFNHIGPRQQDTYAIAHFAKQIAELEGQFGPRSMQVGRLDVERDFTDVRDVVRAYPLLIEKGEPGDCFNVASGVTRSLASLLQVLLSMSRSSIEVHQATDLLRSSDPDKIEVSCEKLKARTAWTPQVPIAQTLEDTLAEWRRKISMP